MECVNNPHFFQSYGLEGMLLDNWPYIGNEKTIKRSKPFKVTRDEYNCYMFYIFADKVKIGALHVSCHDNKYTASNIFVHADHRRKGISGQLIELAYSFLPNMEFSTSVNYMSKGMVKKYKK